MPGYAAALGADLRNIWSDQVLPMIDMFFNSTYFWPGVAVTAVIVFLGSRLLIK